MSLRIGFANVFYTLWDVSEEANTQYQMAGNGSYHAVGQYVSVRYSYLGRLSKDEATAIAKAKERGCSNLEPDHELRGRGSFSRWERRGGGYVEEEIDHSVFRYGKFKGDKISECEDVGYLFWYSKENEYVQKRVLELSDSYYVEDGRLFHNTEKIINGILDGEYEVEAVSNFQIGGINSEGVEEWSIKVNLYDPQTNLEREFCDKFPYGYKVYVAVGDLNLKMREYKGYEYFVPQGMRSFKGQVFRIVEGQISKEEVLS